MPHANKGMYTVIEIGEQLSPSTSRNEQNEEPGGTLLGLFTW